MRIRIMWVKCAAGQIAVVEVFSRSVCPELLELTTLFGFEMKFQENEPKDERT